MSSHADIERDRTLVARAQKNPESFGIIFDLYYSAILSYALRRMGDAQAAEDIAAETFVKAFRALPRFSWRGVPFSAWLYRIAGNEIKMYFRRPARHLSLEALREEGFDTPELVGERELLDELVSRDETFARVTAALRLLSVREQEAIALRYMEEKEMREIADIMRAREGTVRSLISRGMAKLRAILVEERRVQQTAEERILSHESRSALSIAEQN